MASVIYFVVTFWLIIFPLLISYITHNAMPIAVHL